MDTLSFFETVLPASGIKILAELIHIPNRPKPGWKYYRYNSHAAMAYAVQQFEAKGKHIYHACNGYGDWYLDEATNRNRIRTAVNVVSCRSLYDDIDTHKEGCYANKKEAFEAVKALVATTGLPMPLVVDSGGGLHLYWPLTEDVTPQEWSHLSSLKRRITKHLGLKVDRAVDMDLARVLRPVGSTNPKYEPPRPVTGKNSPRSFNPETLRTTMERYIKENNVPPDTLKVKRSDNPFAMLLERDYPDAYADVIAQHCAVVKWFKETGAPDEPLWHKLIGLLKHAKDGAEKIHEWGALYSGYSEAETQAKADAWAHGPTLCTTFKSLSNMCEGCTHQCKSPIALGQIEQTVVEVPPEATPAEVEAAPALTKEELLAKLLPTGYTLNEKGLFASIHMPDDTWQNLPVCDTLFYPIDLTQGEDGEWNAVIEYRTQYGKYRQFSLPTSDISAPDKLCSALAAHTIWIYNTKIARSCVSEFMRKFCVGLQAHKREVKTEKAFGWNDDMTGFVIGTTMVTSNGEKPVLLSDNVMSSGMGRDYGTQGSVADWVSLVERIYNRPGAEAYQFAFLISAAAPLIRLANIQGFHGIPVAYTGKGGRGKTTMCRMACGIWGLGNLFLRSSNPNGSTVNAMVARVSIHRNLPWIMDELTGQEAKDVSGMLFSLSNGEPKDRLLSSGRFANAGLSWDTFTLITGNYNITELLATLDKQMTDAVQVRCFEVQVPDDYNETVFAGVNVKELIDEKLQNCYGSVGRVLLKFYMEKQASIVRNIHKMRQKYVPNTADESRERFYIDTLVFAMVAGHAMKKLGLVNFDLDAVLKWAFANVKHLRTARADKHYSEEEIISHFLSSLHGKTVVTKHVRDGRSGTEIPIEPIRGPISARVALEDKKFFITSKALNDWCKESGYLPSHIRDAMDKLGYIVHMKGRDKSGGFNFRIGAGTNIALGAARGFELNYAKVMGRESQGGNVVALPVANLVADDAEAVESA